MITETRERKRTLLWVFSGILLALILLEVVLLLNIQMPKPEDEEPIIVPATAAVPSTETTADTEPTTVPTTESPIPLSRFTEEDFQYIGEYLGCTAADYMLGVDVSKYQGEVNWEQVRQAGMEFAMIRVGGRGYGQEGKMYTDPMADANYQGAKAAGLLVGAYFFSQATNAEEAVEEAQYALELTQNWELDMPIVFDWEYISQEARTANIGPDVLTECAKAFCEEIIAAGKEPMIYVCPWFFLPNLEELTQYKQWLALYNDEMSYQYHFDMWQYTSTAVVPGIQGDADVNIFFPN